jgi:outer membrane receptor protein involved in Fe transport
LDTGDTWFVLNDFDNHFLYTENIYAAYLIMGNEKKRFGYQGGLRAELSDITTELAQTNDINPRRYVDLFPSIHLSYRVDSTNTVQASYSRRLARPRFRELLPFYGFSDSRSFFSGNPDLDPEFTHSFELGHLKYFVKGSVLSSVYYRLRNGVIERITVVDSSGFTHIFPINLSTQHAVGLEFSGNYDLAPWWRATGSFNFYRAITDGSYDGEDLHSDAYSWSAKASSRWTIKKKLDVQVAFDYNAPSETTQGRSLAMYALDGGISTDFLSGNGTVTLSGRDLLNTRKRRWITQSATYYSETEFQWRSREVTLTFIYRLNQKKKSEKPGPHGGFEGGEDGF